MPDPLFLNDYRSGPGGGGRATPNEPTTTAPLDSGGGGGNNGGMDDIARRVTALEVDMKEVKGLLGDKIVPMLVRIDERLNHTATKAELAEAIGSLRADIAEKPGKGYLWTVVGVLSAAILGAVAIGAAVGPLIVQAIPH